VDVDVMDQVEQEEKPTDAVVVLQHPGDWTVGLQDMQKDHPAQASEEEVQEMVEEEEGQDFEDVIEKLL
jgi:hypothetical protein